jgi:hypothetical protein
MEKGKKFIGVFSALYESDEDRTSTEVFNTKEEAEKWLIEQKDSFMCEECDGFYENDVEGYVGEICSDLQWKILDTRKACEDRGDEWECSDFDCVGDFELSRK